MTDKTTALSSRTVDVLHVRSPTGLDFQFEIAGMGARSHAFIIDWHIRLLLALTWLLAVGFGLYSADEVWDLFKQEHVTAAMLIIFLPAAVIYFLYHPVLEVGMAGRTPGKRMAGVRLVTLQGGSPGVGAILLRNVFRLIDSLPALYFFGLVAVALTRNNVRIGDLASGLVLVYDTTVKPKALQDITNLAMHSGLKPEDQELLLDLLNRWQEMSVETRIRLGQQFLDRIGHPIAQLITVKNSDRALKTALDNLLNKP